MRQEKLNTNSIANKNIIIGYKEFESDVGVFRPSKKHENDHCFDIYTPVKISILPGDTVCIKSNLQLEIPDGYACLLHERSGICKEHHCVVDAGIIDSNYTGEIIVLMSRKPAVSIIQAIKHSWYKFKNEKYYSTKQCLADILNILKDALYYYDSRNSIVSFEKGSRICQMEVVKTLPVVTKKIKKIKQTNRGKKGFGSTGLK